MALAYPEPYNTSMTKQQKGEALLTLEFANNALAQTLTRAGDGRTETLANSVNAAIDALQAAMRELRVTIPSDK